MRCLPDSSHSRSATTRAPVPRVSSVPMTRRLVAAPMVDQSELPFRMLCRSYGAQLCYTPMLHAGLFVHDANYRTSNLTTCPADRPLIVQFCANHAETFATAVKLVAPDCDGVDLNLGCPQGIAKKGHYGAFLQDEWQLISDMIHAASQQVSIPISCKIRIFPDVNMTIRYAEALVAAGAKSLTVHGRTRDMKGAMTGLADWSQIRAVRQAVSVPVFANGNIQFMANTEQCFLETGVDGVMVAEALLSNPAFFSGRHVPVWHLCQQYLQFYDQYPTHLSHVRSHFFRMLHHVLQLPENHALRDEMTKSRTIQDLRAIVDNIKHKYEVEAEDQSLDMSTLPVPVHVSQPIFRSDRLQAQTQAACETLACKRSSQAEAKQATKKKRTGPKKEDRVKNLELCVECRNPRGQRCPHLLCKSCCRKKGSSASCENHCNKKRQKVQRSGTEGGDHDL